jgi:hypothetical protein
MCRKDCPLEGAPVETSIEKARREVQEAFDRARAIAETNEIQTLREVERKLWTAMLEVGRALIALFLARCATRPRVVEYLDQGRQYALIGTTRTSEVGTLFGKLNFTRPIGIRVGAPSVAADLPVDRELGLCTGFSLGVVLAMSRLCAQMAFASARENFRQAYEWAPSPRATMRMVDGTGGEARGFLEQAPAPEDDGDVLVVLVDAGGAPMVNVKEYVRRRLRREARHGGTRRHQRRARRREQPKQRRGPGQKSKNAKMAVVGVLYTLRKTAKGMEGPINKRVYATFESHEELFIWLRREADKRGYGKKPTVFLADGSGHIWRFQEKYFPEAEGCLDWYHLQEYLWAAGKRLHRKDSQVHRWVDVQKKHLRNGKVQTVIDELRRVLEETPKTGPGNKGKRAQLEVTLGYIEEHRPRLRYRELRERDLDIGSGVVEGAVRNLIRMRLDGPGMRWGRHRAECVLHLRCIYLNRQWEEFEAYLSAKGVTLPDQPIPMQPHTATPRKAA